VLVSNLSIATPSHLTSLCHHHHTSNLITSKSVHPANHSQSSQPHRELHKATNGSFPITITISQTPQINSQSTIPAREKEKRRTAAAAAVARSHHHHETLLLGLSLTQGRDAAKDPTPSRRRR
jgi:hypothetical protein